MPLPPAMRWAMMALTLTRGAVISLILHRSRVEAALSMRARAQFVCFLFRTEEIQGV